jgi:two-component system chemotaxis sensor kinase CheA
MGGSMELAPDISPDDIELFLQEADEQLQLLDEDFVKLEHEADSAELLQEIFRAAHTLKGSSAMLGYREMADLAHVMEAVLDQLRNGTLAVSTEVVDALLHGLDGLRLLRDELVAPSAQLPDVSAAVAELAEVGGSAGVDHGGSGEAATEDGLVLDPTAKGRLQRMLDDEHHAFHVALRLSGHRLDRDPRVPGADQPVRGG